MWRNLDMSEIPMHAKKSKSFKDVIAEEKNKGKTRRRIMKIITHINSEVMYGGSFLLVFAVFDVVAYFLLSPSVFVWAGILIASAVVASLFAARLTSLLKKRQWKYV
jgi:membrane protein YdbS with pleckstrin-like domain